MSGATSSARLVLFPEHAELRLRLLAQDGLGACSVQVDPQGCCPSSSRRHDEVPVHPSQVGCELGTWLLLLQSPVVVVWVLPKHFEVRTSTVHAKVELCVSPFRVVQHVPWAALRRHPAWAFIQKLFVGSRSLHPCR